MGLRRGILLFVAALLAGCAQTPAPRAELLETTWRPVEIGGTGATASYRIIAASLELRDAEGKLRIRLEARKSQ
jgi:hypothetical protein